MTRKTWLIPCLAISATCLLSVLLALVPKWHPPIKIIISYKNSDGEAYYEVVNKAGRRDRYRDHNGDDIVDDIEHTESTSSSPSGESWYSEKNRQGAAWNQNWAQERFTHVLVLHKEREAALAALKEKR